MNRQQPQERMVGGPLEISKHQSFAVVVTLPEWQICACFLWIQWERRRQSETRCLTCLVPLSLPLLITWRKCCMNLWFIFDFRSVFTLRTLHISLIHSKPVLNNESWKQVISLFHPSVSKNGFPCRGVEEFSRTPSQLLLILLLGLCIILWVPEVVPAPTGTPGRSHLVLCNGNTHRKQSVDSSGCPADPSAV